MRTISRTAFAMAAGITLVAGLPLAGATSAQAALPAIMITKVYYDSPGSDTGSNSSLNAEYVVVKNTTKVNRSLKGWTLRDKANHVYTFPTFTLKAGASVTIHTGKGSATQYHRYYNKSWYVWNNTGDTAYLRNASGSTVDTCGWTSKGLGYRYC
ncbi:lamin tail-like protein [Humibacillus xanthopallidus]|uniref:Lamin tail-like protein n=1 Tax=Humibacillus xanthopallidus TaxID=412689 RepID=A0A543PX18_9MICO|nr:lamin tail domain-containing protein [Humibacillus xanthopallidus]TQN48619.1 lamin tail-like protein [Humibacillus xanthopallidus]